MFSLGHSSASLTTSEGTLTFIANSFAGVFSFLNGLCILHLENTVVIALVLLNRSELYSVVLLGVEVE